MVTLGYISPVIYFNELFKSIKSSHYFGQVNNKFIGTLKTFHAIIYVCISKTTRRIITITYTVYKHIFYYFYLYINIIFMKYLFNCLLSLQY